MKQLYHYLISALFAVVAFFAGLAFGKNATLDKAAVAALAAQKAEADVSYQALQKNVSDTNVELTKNSQRLARLDGYEAKVASLSQQITQQSGQAKKLADDLASKQEELATITRHVDAVKSQPIILPAGDFVVGTDIKAGRYTVRGTSNFIVHDTDGENKVNTILGGDNGVDSYVCDLEDGDQIHAEGRDAFYPL